LYNKKNINANYFKFSFTAEVIAVSVNHRIVSHVKTATTVKLFKNTPTSAPIVQATVNIAEIKDMIEINVFILLTP
jgi:hypothetical protein